MIKVYFNGSKFTADAELVRKILGVMYNPNVEVFYNGKFDGDTKKLADDVCSYLTTLLNNGKVVTHRNVFTDIKPDTTRWQDSYFSFQAIME